MTIRHRLSAFSLALATSLPFTLPLALPGTALAQTSAASQRAVISNFEVQPAQRLRPGEVLTFQVNGTPGAQASVQIAGAAAPAVLTETRPGTYNGDYTIRQQDRLSADTVATARLVKNGQWAELPLNRTLLAGAQWQGQNAQGMGIAQISDFSIDGPDRVRPGDELNFTLRGSPRAQASVAVQGVDQRIALRETSPGVYQGNYVLRRADQVRGEPVAQAYLVSDRREVTRRYERTQARSGDGDGREPRAPAACAHCGRVVSVNQVDVDGDSKNIIGSVAGGVLGGVLGHQVGGGSGKDLATVIGAVGGAYAGNRIQNNADKKRVHRVAVRLDSGQTQTFDYADDPQMQVGTLVRVEDGVLRRR